MGEAREQGHVVCDVTVQPFRMAAMWPPGPHQLYSPVFCGMPGDRATFTGRLFHCFTNPNKRREIMPEDNILTSGTDDTVTPDEGTEQGTSVDETEVKEPEAEVKEPEEGEKADEEKPDEDEEKKESEVPEKYDIKLPDGIEMDETALELFSPLFREMELSNEKAQKLTDAYVELRKSEMKAYADQVEKWKSDAKGDAEYGGRAFKENAGLASKAMNEVFSDKTIALLDSVGFTSHPELIRDLWKLGTRMGDDKWVDGRGSKADDESSLTAEQKLAKRYAKT